MSSRFVSAACVVAAVLWLPGSYGVVPAAYHLRGEVGRKFHSLKRPCVYQRFTETRVEFASRSELESRCHGSRHEMVIDRTTDPPRYACVTTEAVGKPFRGKSNYGHQIAVMAVGLIIGVVPAFAFLWVGFGRPVLPRRRDRA